MTPDLDALERLAEAAASRDDFDSVSQFVSMLDPETVRTLIRWARLGKAAAALPAGWRAKAKEARGATGDCDDAYAVGLEHAAFVLGELAEPR